MLLMCFLLEFVILMGHSVPVGSRKDVLASKTKWEDNKQWSLFKDILKWMEDSLQNRAWTNRWPLLCSQQRRSKPRKRSYIQQKTSIIIRMLDSTKKASIFLGGLLTSLYGGCHLKACQKANHIRWKIWRVHFILIENIFILVIIIKSL